jgi:Family of unknown function (DUF6510)
MSLTDDSLVLDGNAAAGLLAEIFGGTEMTGALRSCGSCEQEHAVGKHRLYRGAGLVLRCPGCGDVALIVVECGARREVRISGRWALNVPGVA